MSEYDFYAELLAKESNYMKTQCPAYRFYLSLRTVLAREVEASARHMADALRAYNAEKWSCALQLYQAAFARGLELYDTVRAGGHLPEGEEPLLPERFGAEYMRAVKAMHRAYAQLQFVAEDELTNESAQSFTQWLGDVNGAIFDLEGRFFCIFAYRSRIDHLKWENVRFTGWLERRLLPNRGSL